MLISILMARLALAVVKLGGDTPVAKVQPELSRILNGESDCVMADVPCDLCGFCCPPRP